MIAPPSLFIQFTNHHCEAFRLKHSISINNKAIDSINKNTSSLQESKTTPPSLRGSGDSHNEAIHDAIIKTDSISRQTCHCEERSSEVIYNANKEIVESKIDTFTAIACNDKEIDSINPLSSKVGVDDKTDSTNPNNLPIIPIMHCFDENYCLPASVSFYSMLENASKEYFYKLYVVYSDNISEDSKAMLYKTIESFPNASLEFINKGGYYDSIWEAIDNKAHFSKEVFYKLSVASIFPQYEKIIVTDVDVVWNGDISSQFNLLNIDDDIYIGGYDAPMLNENCPLRAFMKWYDKSFSQEEIDSLMIGAGLVVYNLKKIREDKLESKFIDYLHVNANRLLQPEQDVLNLVCYPKISVLSKNGMVSTYFWEMFDTEYKINNASWEAKDIQYALDYPIQIHYPGPHAKPWKNFNTIKSDIWFKYLVKTPYLNEWLDSKYNEFEKYQRFYNDNKENEIYPKFKNLVHVPCILTIAKRKGIIKISMLHIIRLYLDFSVLRKK